MTTQPGANAFPITPPVEPMLAKLAAAIPPAGMFLFEPKWDGFRAIVFRGDADLYIQSRELKPLDRYFPELREALLDTLPGGCVIDGEIVITTPQGLDFDALQLRLHPAASRVAKLSREIPASFVAFDVLAAGGQDVMALPQSERRETLERLLAGVGPPVYLTPMTRDRDVAARWLDEFEGAGLDGVIAKPVDDIYQPGKRTMIKVKHARTAECVVAGFRWHKSGRDAVGSLLLGLYDDRGVLQHVGVTSSFTMAMRRQIVEELAPLRENALENHPWRSWAEAGAEFNRMPGAQSRWSAGKDLSWEPLRAERVCEVKYDHLQGNRFRHAAVFLRWRLDKSPADCRYDQLEVTTPYELSKVFSPDTLKRRLGGIHDLATHASLDILRARVRRFPREPCQTDMTLESLKQDFNYAVRGLRAKPGFTVAVVATLALGIGANAAMFGIVDRLLFRPPALMRDPATVHRPYFYQTFRGTERAGGDGRYARYKDLERWTSSFSQMAGHTQRDLAVGVGDAAREMHIGIVTSSFFDFFDAAPVAGRYFTDAEDQPPAGTPVAVLSHSMWRTEYGSRRDVLGSTMQIGPTVYTIIGVAAPGFVGLWPDKPPAAFIPLTSYAAGAFAGFLRANANWWTTYSLGWMSTIMRRKPGVSIETANADLTNAFLQSYRAQIVEQPGTTDPAIARPHAIVGSILADRGPNQSNVSKVATWVAGVSVLVLLIACANVANLLLARALHRRREIALRLALGVTRVRLVSQLLIESLVLALAGGIAGLFVAHWGGAALRAFLLEKSEAAAGLHDPRTILFAGAAAVVVGVLCGLAPVLQARRADLTGDLKAGAREGTYGRSRMRTGLLLVQGALSVLLLVGAGLFVRSVRNVGSIPLGYDTEPVLIVNLNMRGVTLDSTATLGLRRRLLDAAKGVPGVENASLQAAVPFWSTTSSGLHVEGIDTVSRLGQFALNRISPEYFPTMGTRILRGRGIEDGDTPQAPRAAVVSEAMGKVLWPGKDPIGQCMKVMADTMPCTFVVGVAENIKAQSLGGDSSYYYYLSAQQSHPVFAGLFVRTHGNGKRLIEDVRRRLQQEMPGASYVTIMPFSDIIGSQTRSWRLGATMFAAFGVLALVLAAIGLYSVIAYNVAQRTHELGVRVALGAQMGDLVRLVVMDGLRLAAVGVVIGAGIALWAGRWVEPLLLNVSPRDPAVLLSVSVILTAVAVAASWIPALRASRVDPNVVLRSE